MKKLLPLLVLLPLCGCGAKIFSDTAKTTTQTVASNPTNNGTGSTTPTTPNTKPSSVPYIGGPRQAAARTVALTDLKDLHLLIEYSSQANEGRMPTRDFILAAMKKEKPKMAEAIEDGTVVLTGIQQREGVWAYHVNAPVSGGFVVTHNGVENLSAADAKRLIHGQ